MINPTSQYWFCNLCEQVGGVRVVLNETTEHLIHKIGVAHRKLRSSCVGDVHIVEEDRYTSWLSIVIDDRVPSWVVTPLAQLLGYGNEIPGGNRSHG